VVGVPVQGCAYLEREPGADDEEEEVAMTANKGPRVTQETLEAATIRLFSLLLSITTVSTAAGQSLPKMHETPSAADVTGAHSVSPEAFKYGYFVAVPGASNTYRFVPAPTPKEPGLTMFPSPDYRASQEFQLRSQSVDPNSSRTIQYPGLAEANELDRLRQLVYEQASKISLLHEKIKLLEAQLGKTTADKK
jgi:hypothetical protein